MLIEAMAIHEALKKYFFESNLKRKHNIAFSNTSDFGSKCNE
jgi:hypothetical protein